MARIYDEKSEELYKLLEKAAQSTGATLVIPDLQRPYVWTPNQVTLLIDSLIRGWPFGTLLLWRVEHDEKRNIPSRAFWQIVDRTGEADGRSLLELQPPAEYQMVLDGQQRIQSLLLATHGDNWGFKLLDADWAIETGTKSTRGKNSSSHWSHGCLCLDLELFLRAYQDAREELNAVEFDKALVWAVIDERSGRSRSRRLKTYKDPILSRFAPEHSQRLIRFSRLWDLAGTTANLKEKNYHEPLRQLLRDHGLEDVRIQPYIQPLAELMTTLREVKVHKVAFLELSAYSAGNSSREAYDDAIVNIFTRLNTAGRTLTREEITFAWLKVGWNTAKTDDKSAQDCFSELQGELELGLEIDELVSAVSLLWSVVFNKGSLLTNRDLLRGDIIRPMAGDLSSAWREVSAAVVDVMNVVSERKLERGRHYSSVNALAVLWAARFQTNYCASRMKLSPPARDHLERSLEKILHEYIDRWLICSTWAERWAQASGQILINYASQLAGDSAAFDSATNVDALLDVHRTRLEKMVKDLEPEAISYVDRLAVESREKARNYFTALWIWHRLDKARWQESDRTLRIGRSKKSSLEVDHAIAVKIWDPHLPVIKGYLEEGDSPEQIINSLGNCMLLQKSFNISKSAQPLVDFLNQVHELKGNVAAQTAWGHALGFRDAHLKGNVAEPEAMVDAVRYREAEIRADLVKFVRGESRRVDVT